MNDFSTSKPNTYFWIISILALIWNGMGVYAYLNNAFMSEETFAQMSGAEQQLMENLPSWVVGAFAIAVFAGFLASLGLLLRKKWASPLFGLSLVALIVQQVYNQLMAKMYTVLGAESLVFAVLLVVIGVALYLLSRNWIKKGWLA